MSAEKIDAICVVKVLVLTRKKENSFTRNFLSMMIRNIIVVIMPDAKFIKSPDQSGVPIEKAIKTKQIESMARAKYVIHDGGGVGLKSGGLGLGC